MTADRPLWFTSQEVADRFNVSQGYILKLLTRGLIKGSKPFGNRWRISREEVERLEQEQRESPGQTLATRREQDDQVLTIAIPEEDRGFLEDPEALTTEIDPPSGAPAEDQNEEDQDGHSEEQAGWWPYGGRLFGGRR